MLNMFKTWYKKFKYWKTLIVVYSITLSTTIAISLWAMSVFSKHVFVSPDEQWWTALGVVVTLFAAVIIIEFVRMERYEKFVESAEEEIKKLSDEYDKYLGKSNALILGMFSEFEFKELPHDRWNKLIAFFNDQKTQFPFNEMRYWISVAWNQKEYEIALKIAKLIDERATKDQLYDYLLNKLYYAQFLIEYSAIGNVGITHVETYTENQNIIKNNINNGLEEKSNKVVASWYYYNEGILSMTKNKMIDAQTYFNTAFKIFPDSSTLVKLVFIQIINLSNDEKQKEELVVNYNELIKEPLEDKKPKEDSYFSFVESSKKLLELIIDYQQNRQIDVAKRTSYLLSVSDLHHSLSINRGPIEKCSFHNIYLNLEKILEESPDKAQVLLLYLSYYHYWGCYDKNAEEELKNEEKLKEIYYLRRLL